MHLSRKFMQHIVFDYGVNLVMLQVHLLNNLLLRELEALGGKTYIRWYFRIDFMEEISSKNPTSAAWYFSLTSYEHSIRFLELGLQ